MQASMFDVHVRASTHTSKRFNWQAEPRERRTSGALRILQFVCSKNPCLSSYVAFEASLLSAYLRWLNLEKHKILKIWEKWLLLISHQNGSSLQSNIGFTGLYRGIGSNIASSAPISAVYTFTYESVREALLPFLPKEYYSFAHCTAGGCASIDTSFIFTPSERIKQQMQIGSRYQNCWNALTGIIEKGGLPSLYAGWGAVLCGNIPHAIIKETALKDRNSRK